MVHTHIHTHNWISIYMHTFLSSAQTLWWTDRVIFMLSLQTAKVSLWQAGVARITNWRVLIQNYNVSMSVNASKMSMFLVPTNFSSLFTLFAIFLSESNWSPPCGDSYPVSQKQTDTHRSICKWHGHHIWTLLKHKTKLLNGKRGRQTVIQLNRC